MGSLPQGQDQASPLGDAPTARSAAIVASAQQRRRDSRERLLSAATDLFARLGYPPVSVEDIAQAAGVSRVTFYRHFASKAALATELFWQLVDQGRPLLTSICSKDANKFDDVRSWIAALFAADRSNRAISRVFMQTGAVEPSFAHEAHNLLSQLIAALGRTIPAFNLDPDKPADRRRWLEAWLLLFEILDQSNHSALDSGVAMDPLVIDILADRFVRFVETSHG